MAGWPSWSWSGDRLLAEQPIRIGPVRAREFYAGPSDIGRRLATGFAARMETGQSSALDRSPRSAAWTMCPARRSCTGRCSCFSRPAVRSSRRSITSKPAAAISPRQAIVCRNISRPRSAPGKSRRPCWRRSKSRRPLDSDLLDSIAARFEAARSNSRPAADGAGGTRAAGAGMEAGQVPRKPAASRGPTGHAREAADGARCRFGRDAFAATGPAP